MLTTDDEPGRLLIEVAAAAVQIASDSLRRQRVAMSAAIAQHRAKITGDL